ncbi:hypothetical protein ACWCP6_04295 [Streptomyces sp. NPDC002004]
MTSPAALPSAALRIARTAAGRRVLQVALLLGGLFVLGFLCGEQAHAAERVAGPAPVERTVATADPVDSGRVAGPAVRHVRHVVGTAGRYVERPGAEHSVEPVVRPAGKLLGTIHDGLAEPPRHGLPGLPGLPAPQLPGGPAAVQPSAPSHGGSADRPAGAGAHRITEGTARPAHRAAHEPVSSALPGGFQGHVAPIDRHTAVHADTGRAPLPMGGGVPGGALGSQAAVDTGAPRHGDLHAVTFGAHAPFRPVPGGTAASVVGPTRDRYRDIPEFPG